MTPITSNVGSVIGLGSVVSRGSRMTRASGSSDPKYRRASVSLITATRCACSMSIVENPRPFTIGMPSVSGSRSLQNTTSACDDGCGAMPGTLERALQARQKEGSHSRAQRR